MGSPSIASMFDSVRCDGGGHGAASGGSLADRTTGSDRAPVCHRSGSREWPGELARPVEPRWRYYMIALMRLMVRFRRSWRYDRCVDRQPMEYLTLWTLFGTNFLDSRNAFRSGKRLLPRLNSFLQRGSNDTPFLQR
jgi:hypothetical protein